MSAAKVLHDIFQADQYKDPGASGSITVDRSPCYVALVSAAAETRTLKAPLRAGAIVTLAMKTDGGDITLTVTGGLNETGDTTFVFSDAGQFIQLTSVESASGTFVWRKTSDYGSGNLALSGLNATVAELNVAADGSANTVVVAAAGAAVTALAGGGTYLVPLVTANVTFTLPAATLGEKHKFVFIGSAADAEDWVITSPTLFVGGPAFFDVGGTNAAVYANGSSHAILTVNNPAAGTEITFIGDGTNWAVTGTVSSADAPAFT